MDLIPRYKKYNKVTVRADTGNLGKNDDLVVIVAIVLNDDEYYDNGSSKEQEVLTIKALKQQH